MFFIFGILFLLATLGAISETYGPVGCLVVVGIVLLVILVAMA